MAKIVIDAREYTTSTGRYMFRLLQYLEQLESNHEFVILLKPHDMEAYEFSNPRFTKVVCPYKEFTFSEQLGYYRQINRLEADLVHFGKTEQPVLYRGRTVTTVHDLINALMHNPSRYRNPVYFKFKQLVYRWVIRRVAHKSAAILAPTEFIKQQLANFSHIDPAKIVVTPEAADYISEEAEIVPGLEKISFIMYVGRPTLHKNLGRLLDAFEIMQQERPELHLVLAGKKDANYEAHEAAVRERRIRNVMFTGFISDGQLKWLYEHCKAYVFPSLSEGFGLPGLEAMMHGAPVISSNATCLPEVYGEGAYYFNPLDIRDMAKKIGEVVDDPILREELCEKGKRQVAKYSWRRMAEQTLEVYERALRK